ncbi:hypothetical protein B0H13DRAFT_1885201 [Mycena leptocephala]|nr:hypothetical protein B0H13DRAFT_1885201 [Mycena leptocephala]
MAMVEGKTLSVMHLNICRCQSVIRAGTTASQECGSFEGRETMLEPRVNDGGAGQNGMLREVRLEGSTTWYEGSKFDRRQRGQKMAVSRVNEGRGDIRNGPKAAKIRVEEHPNVVEVSVWTEKYIYNSIGDRLQLGLAQRMARYFAISNAPPSGAWAIQTVGHLVKHLRFASATESAGAVCIVQLRKWSSRTGTNEVGTEVQLDQTDRDRNGNKVGSDTRLGKKRRDIGTGAEGMDVKGAMRDRNKLGAEARLGQKHGGEVRNGAMRGKSENGVDALGQEG